MNGSRPHLDPKQHRRSTHKKSRQHAERIQTQVREQFESNFAKKMVVTAIESNHNNNGLHPPTTISNRAGNLPATGAEASEPFADFVARLPAGVFSAALLVRRHGSSRLPLSIAHPISSRRHAHKNAGKLPRYESPCA